MSDPRTQPETDQVLAELLEHCRTAATECFRAGCDGGFDDDRRIYRLAGVKVVKASLDIIAAMNGGAGQSTHRFLYERRSPEGNPPYHGENRKTKTNAPQANGRGA